MIIKYLLLLVAILLTPAYIAQAGQGMGPGPGTYRVTATSSAVPESGFESDDHFDGWAVGYIPSGLGGSDGQAYPIQGTVNSGSWAMHLESYGVLNESGEFYDGYNRVFIEKTVTTGSTLSFYTWCGSDGGNIDVYVDGVKKTALRSVGAWSQRTIAVTPGVHTIRFTSANTDGYAGGTWLDDIAY